MAGAGTPVSVPVHSMSATVPEPCGRLSAAQPSTAPDSIGAPLAGLGGSHTAEATRSRLVPSDSTTGPQMITAPVVSRRHDPVQPGAASSRSGPPAGLDGSSTPSEGAAGATGCPLEDAGGLAKGAGEAVPLVVDDNQRNGTPTPVVRPVRRAAQGAAAVPSHGAGYVVPPAAAAEEVSLDRRDDHTLPAAAPLSSAVTPEGRDGQQDARPRRCVLLTAKPVELGSAAWFGPIGPQQPGAIPVPLPR